MTFYVYLDESGDEGLSYQPPPKKHGKEWFIISAVVVDARAYRSVAARFAAYKRQHRKQANWHFHFVNVSHDERIGFLTWLAGMPVACMSMLVHKPSLENREAFSLPNGLYFYSARILLERISWYCVNTAGKDITATPDAQMVFSRRRGLKEDDLREYLFRLLRRTNDELQIDPSFVSNSIDWRAIQPDKTWVREHSTLVGLQLADAVASGVAKAVEFNNHGLTEHRYAKILKPIIYKRYGTYRSYGLKFFPKFPNQIATEPRFDWLQKFK